MVLLFTQAEGLEYDSPGVEAPRWFPAGIVEHVTRWLEGGPRAVRTLFGEVEPTHRSLLDAITGMLDTHDPETLGHCQRVARFALTLGDALGLEIEQLDTLQQGALLHDIGKIGVPQAVLRKPGSLTPAEWQQMRQHPDYGDCLLSRFSALRPALPVVRHHHERYDGLGYPDGLAGTAIPLVARIFAVIDTFDAMISDRPYRPAMPVIQAMVEIRRGAGTQFDPRVVKAFIASDPRRWVVRNAPPVRRAKEAPSYPRRVPSAGTDFAG